MGGVRHWLGIALALSLSGCATLTAPDEVKALQEATDDFSDALKAADLDMEAAGVATIVERYRFSASVGEPVFFTTTCVSSFDDMFEGSSGSREALIGRAYRSSVADKEFRKIRSIGLCELDCRDARKRAEDTRKNRSPESCFSSKLGALEESADIDFGGATVMSVDAPTLSLAARRLRAYVEALSDIATGASSGKLDAARHKAVVAGTGLLKALKIGGPTETLVGLGEQVANSIIAGRRNALTRDFLDRMDKAMPLLMERIGAYARLAVVDAVRNRSSVAQQVALFGNASLNRRRPVAAGSAGSVARLALFDSIMARLGAQNGIIMRLRGSDPMLVARDFAKAHRELREVYHDPKRARQAIAEGLAKFQESASALADALKSTEAG